MKCVSVSAPAGFAVKTYAPSSPVISPISAFMAVMEVACMVRVLAAASSSRPLAIDTREADESNGELENEMLIGIVLAVNVTVTRAAQLWNIVVTSVAEAKLIAPVIVSRAVQPEKQLKKEVTNAVV